MANNYTQYAIQDTLKCSQKDAEKLQDLLDACNDNGHGFDMEFYPSEKDSKIGELHIYAESNGNPDAFSDEFLNTLGKIIKKDSSPYITLGYAFTCDKMRPGDFGGGELRITDKGEFIYPKIVWDDSPAPPDVRHLVSG
jgi:hypothetical protein